MERKSRNRLRLVNLKAVGPAGLSGDSDTPEAGKVAEIMALSLSQRVLISEQAEVWTVCGVLRDGKLTSEDIGELSLALIPGDTAPATSVTGFLAPSPPYQLAMPEPRLKEELHLLMQQLGYERDGYYLSVGFGGGYLYHESFPPV